MILFRRIKVFRTDSSGVEGVVGRLKRAFSREAIVFVSREVLSVLRRRVEKVNKLLVHSFAIHSK